MRKILLFVLATFTFICGSLQVHAQVASSANYTFSTGSSGSLSQDLNSNAIDLSSQPDLANLGSSSALSPMSIGFDFWFMGNRHNIITPQVRGNAGLGLLPPFGTAPLPNLNAVSTTTSPTLAPFWNQSAFTPATGRNIRSAVVGSAPNRCLVIEWRLLGQNASIANTNPDFTFQMRLYETTGVIEYVYGTMVVPQNTTAGTLQAAIGFTTLQNQLNTLASVTDLSTYTATTNPLSVNNAVVNQASGAITGLASGRFFRWTPLTPAAPTGLTFTGVTQNSTTLNWTDNATNEFGYAIYRSDDGGTNYNFITQTAQNVNTFTQTFLQPSTTYFYRVVAVTEGSRSANLQNSQTTTASGAIASTGAGGSWSSTTTWAGGIVPTITDNVTIADGSTVTIDIPNAYCNNLTVGSGASGILRYSATAPSSLFINGNATVANNGTFDCGTSSIQTHTLTIGGFPANGATGSLTVNGTFNMSTTTSPNSGAGVTVTFGGFGNGTISGSGATCNFYSVVVNKGNFTVASQNPMLDVTRVITINAPTNTLNRLTITSGTFRLSSATTITPYFGSSIICSGAGRLWLNNAGASISQVGYGTLIGAGAPTVNGELRIDNGTFNFGSGNNTMAFGTSTVNGFTVGGRLTMSGGTLNMLGAVSFTGSNQVFFTMSGGNFNINPQSANMLGTATTILTFGSSTNMIWSGGTVTIVNPHSREGGTSVTTTSFGNKSITGGTLQIGDGISGLASGPLVNTTGFALNLASPIWNLVINNRTDLSPTRLCRLVTATPVIYGNVTVNNNSYLMLSSGGTGFTLQMVNGNITNNGIISGMETTGTSILGALGFYANSGTQTISGTGTFTNIAAITLAPWFSGVGINATQNVVFNQTNAITVNIVNLLSGTLTHNGKLTIGRPNNIPTVQIGGGGVLTTPGSFASVPNFDFTSFPLQLNYFQSNIAYTMGAYNEIAPGNNNVWNLLVTNVKGLTIERNLTVTGTLVMTTGNISIGNNNLTLGVGSTQVGTLTYTQGNIICGATGTFTRWYNTTAAPTSVVAASQFPVGSSVIGESRHAWVFLNIAAGLSAAGTISVRHANVTGITAMTTYNENVVNMDTRTQSSWVFSTGNGLTLGAGTISLAIRGDGAVMLPATGTVANVTITDASGAAFAGTFSAGTGTINAPQGNRTGIATLAALTATPVYLGSPSANIQGVITAINTGTWNTPATWSGGVVPTATDNVVIAANVTVNTSGGAACVANNVIMQPGSTLNIDGNTTTFSRNLTLTGSSSSIQTWATVNVTAGTLNVTGDALGGGVLTNANSFFNLSGGIVNVGNGTNCSKSFQTLASSIINITGGTLNIYGSYNFYSSTLGTTLGVLNQSAGNINIYPLGPIGGPFTAAASVVGHSFCLNNTGVVYPGVLNGGTITIVDPPFAGAVASASVFLYASTSGNAITGSHTFRMGDGSSTATNASPFNIETYFSGYVPINNLIINGGSTPNRHTETSFTTGLYGLFVKGTMTINALSEFRHTLANYLAVGGSLINNGTLTEPNTGGTYGLQLGLGSGITGFTNGIGNITVSGSGVFQNAVSSPTGNIGSLILNINNSSLKATIVPNNLSITNYLLMTSGQLDIGTNNLILGITSTSAAATLSYIAGSQILTSVGGSVTRVIPATGLPTAIATGNLGHFPLGRMNTNVLPNVVERRDAFVAFSGTSITTAGSITFQHTNTSGNTTVTPFTDGALANVDTRTNSVWNINNTGLNLGATTMLMRTYGENTGVAPYPTATATTLMLSGGIAAGTYAASTNALSSNTTGEFNRTGLVLADVTNINYYGGVSSTNNAGGNIFSIANGDWNSTSTWSTGTIPTATDNVQLMAPYTVTVSNGATNFCQAGTVNNGATLLVNNNTLTVTNNIINAGTVTIGGGTVTINNGNTVGNGFSNILSGASLTVNGGTLNLGPTNGGAASLINSSGTTVTISAGTVNLNGNLSMTTGTFNMSGGVLNIDGNSGTGATSVPIATNIVQFTGATQNITGGTIVVVDPPISGGLAYNQTSGSTWTNTNLIFGNGVSTQGSTAAYTVTTPASTQSTGFGVAITGGVPSTLIVNGGVTANRFVSINAITLQATNLVINTNSELRSTQNTGTSSNFSVLGNLINNGTLTTNQNSTLSFGGTVPQIVSGTGTFRVDSASLITANINNLTISNSTVLGVTWNAGSMVIGGYSANSGTLALSGSPLIIGANTFTLGTSATAVGALTGASSNAMIVHSAGGGFRRWYSATAAPTAALLASQFPLGIIVNGTLLRRDFYAFFSSVTLTTGGTLTATHTNTAGFTGVASFTDGALLGVDTRTNGFWNVTNNGISTAGTIGAAAIGNGMLFPVTLANTTLMSSTLPLGGTYGAGTGTQASPQANRTGMAMADLTASPGIYIGTPSANAVGNIFTVQTGNWSDVNTWSTGTIPTATDNVTINPFHYITLDVNGSTRDLTIAANSVLYVNANTLTVNRDIAQAGGMNVNGGTVTIVGSAATAGLAITTGTVNLVSGIINVGQAPNFNRTFTTSGTLNVSGGTLNVNGNVVLGGTFNQSGGSIVVDGNDNSTTAGSVASGTNIFQITSTIHNVTGGSITIIDPPAAGAGLAFNYNSSTSVSWINHTLNFGDGISTTQSGTALSAVNSGFGVSTSTATTTGRLTLHNVVVNGNGTLRYVTVAGTTSNSLDIGNNLTINSGSELRTIGAATATTPSLNVGGNIINNGRLVIGSNTTLAMRINASAASSTVQTYSGTGQLLNDTLATCSPCIANLFVNNTTNSGVDFSGVTGTTLTIDQPLGVLSSTLTLGTTASYLKLGSKNLVLGGSIAKPGVLINAPVANGGFVLTTGTITRWFAASTISGTTGVFPIGIANAPVNFNRVFTVTAGTALTTGGTITVSHTNTGGNTSFLTPFTDAAVSIDRRTNAYWTVSTANGLASAGATMSAQVQGSGYNLQGFTNVADLRLTAVSAAAAGVSGTNGGSILDPFVLRNTLDNTMLASNFYIGGNANNSLANGTIFWTGANSTLWSNAGNWSGNFVPSLSDDVVIPSSGVTNEPSLPGNISIKSVSIQPGRTISLGANTLSLTGNLVNAATIAGTGSVILNGSTSQTLSGGGSISNLTINNSGSGVTVGSSSSDNMKITGVLTPTLGNITTTGQIVLKSTSIANTAQVGVVGAGVTIGNNVQVERFIPSGNRAFRLLAPGVINSSIWASWQESGTFTSGLGTHVTGLIGTPGSNDATTGLDMTVTGNSSLHTYTPAGGFVPITNTKTTNFTDAKLGYRLLVRGDRTSTNITNASLASMNAATTLRATGQLATSTQTFALTGINAQFNLVGNPYWAQVDWNALSNTKTNLNTNFWIWDPTMSGTNGRGAYVAASSGNIQPGQAFFVQNSGGVGTLGFTEASKNVGGTLTNTFRTSLVGDGKLIAKLYLEANYTNKLMADIASTEYSSSYKPAIDKDDAVKFGNPDENMSFKTLGTTLSINATTLPKSDDTLYLNMSNMLSKNYVLEIEGKEFASANTLNAYLVDSYLGNKTIIDLSGTINVPYIIDNNPASANASRYYIVFAEKLLPIAVQTTTVKLAPNPATSYVQISYAAKAKGTTTIRVVNANGQVVNSVNLGEQQTGQYKMAVSKLAAGMYTVEVLIGEEKGTAKLVKQ